tara:strand:+ start:1541 stop:4276 length:2736 start_codon:yes stop_codon:yes gene_type:complete
MTIMKWSAQLAKALLIAVLLYPAAAMAVGFGEITLKSALNEPLNAEIALTNVDKIEEGMLLVQLASPAAFTQAGVSRDYYLTQLRFAVTASASGDTVVLVTSEAPISEPYLDFLVQLEWPAGRMIREYTLLLDLPIYSGEKGGEKVVAPIQTATAGAPKVRRSTNQLSGSEHRVVVGDTLWNVARRLRPQGLTILQTMDALYTQNPKAFVAGNANNMKKGSILRLPSETDIGLEDGDIVASQIGINGPGQIAAVTSKSATAAEEPKEPKELAEVLEASAEETPQVAEEEQLFPEEDLFPEDDLYSKETVDESADAEGRLELASAYDADGSSNGSNSEPNGQSNGQSNGGSNGLADQNGGVNEVQQLNSELAVAEDEVNKTQLDNNELRERNSLLEAQVSTLATLAEVAEEQAEAVPAKAKPVTKADPTAMEKATKAADSLVLLLEKKPMYAWGGLAALVLLVVILFLWLTRKRTIDVNDFPIRPLPVPPEEVIIDTGADQLIDDAEGGHLNPDESLFDETDKEIFAEEDSKVSKEIFGSMVEAMEEAEVYVSLGDTDGAIRVLERARRVSASDTACRLRLMELLFKEGSTDKLKLIAEEINKTEDEEAMAMAAVIVGDKQEMTLNPASLAVDEKPTLEEPSPFQEPSADDSMFDEEEPSVAQWGEPAADESTADEEPSASLNEEPSAALNEDNEPSASPNEEPSAALNEEHDPSEEDSAADTELTLDEEPSASLNEELSASLNEELSAVLDKEHEPSVAPNEELPEVDSLEELESSGDAAIDELAESVLDEDFLDGGIFADVGQATEPKEHKVPEDLGLQVDAEDLPGTADLENSMGDEAAAIAEFMASLDDFDGAEDAEEISSVDVKLDLANTFIEMGDPEGAREILKEIIGEADQAGQARAQLVLETLG